MVLTLAELDAFTGIENIYQHSLGKIYYTDGVKYLATKGEAFWLLDAIRHLQHINWAASADGKIEFYLVKMSQLKEYIETHPSETQRLVGLDYEQLIELINQAERLHNQKQLAIEPRKTRIIKAGGGRRSKLNQKAQILLTLVYLHHLPTFQMLGGIFGVSESAANYTFHYWLEILRELLPASLVEQVKKTDSEWE